MRLPSHQKRGERRRAIILLSILYTLLSAEPTNTPKGSLVVYATEAGKVANDNAKFINALIENINKPNQQIESLGSNISRVVAKKTNYTQIPVVYAKLLPENMV